MGLTLKNDRKVKMEKQAAERQANESAFQAQRFEGLLISAMNHPEIKSAWFGKEGITEGRIDLTVEDQIELLETYARVLEREYHEFVADFPDTQGGNAGKEFLNVRKEVLEHVASHRIELAQGMTESESEMVRPSPETLARIERAKREKDYQEEQRVRAAARG